MGHWPYFYSGAQILEQNSAKFPSGHFLQECPICILPFLRTAESK